MNWQSFWHLHGLIEGDPVFLSKGRKPQRPVKYQLVVFLLKAGGSFEIQAAGVTGMAEGTVSIYVRCICHALKNIRTRHLFWPGQARRAFLKNAMAQYGFPGCIGIVDGTLIRLLEKPTQHGWSYYCQKQYYAVS
jgi:hypothetical protein